MIQKYSWLYNRKGKTWEEIYGKEKAKELRINMKERISGGKNPMFGKKRLDLLERNLKNNPMKNYEVAKKNGDSHRGKTKENNESVRKMAETKRGRTKETYKYLKDQSDRMKKDKNVKKHLEKIRKQKKNPSKDELKLRRIVKELYPTSEHTHKVLENKGYEVDNAILEFKIAIEYDGWYHFDTEENEEYHKKRQQEIEQDGWRFIRYNIFQKFPTLEQVKEDITKIIK